jgi:hypothetical protein
MVKIRLPHSSSAVLCRCVRLRCVELRESTTELWHACVASSNAPGEPTLDPSACESPDGDILVEQTQ